MSALGETPGAELLKVGETFTGNPEPSPRQGEGVETRRAAPTADKRQGEGIVQTTNAGWAAAKAEVVRKSVGPQGLCRFESGRPHQYAKNYLGSKRPDVVLLNTTTAKSLTEPLNPTKGYLQAIS